MALAGPFVADLVANGRDDVRLYVTIGMAITPIGLVIAVLHSVNWAEQRWVMWTVVRCIPSIGGLAVTVTLYATGNLTVATAAIAALLLPIVALGPLSSVLRRAGRPRFERSLAREGLRFGSRSWLYEVGQLTNARLDQVMMTRAVSSGELGLYSVAVNATTLQAGLTGAILSAIFPRVAGGDRALVQRALRSTLLVVVLLSAALIATVSVFLPLLFGQAFAGAVPMARILLVASIVAAGTGVLATGLTAGGRPELSARAQFAGLFVTIPGLLLLLPRFGGEGAALVSLAAYGLTFGVLLKQTVQVMGGSYADYLVPRRADWQAARSSPLARRIARLLRRSDDAG
jgi:O-antigen/teichoic acid export membrane protein